MAETTAKITVNVYAGVPFNNKYKNVLFVDKTKRDTFLSTYEVGTAFESNRFQIIDDTNAMIDISNDFGVMQCNYVKIHTELTPQATGNSVEYDSFYFVTRTRQIATNTIRLYLEIDIFQTSFNRYDYENKVYEIPQIKNSVEKITTDYINLLYTYESLIKPQYFQNGATYTPLFARTDAQGKTKVRMVMHFATDTEELCCISKSVYNLDFDGAVPINNNISNIIDAIYSSKNMVVYAQNENITVFDVYLIPEEFFIGASFASFTNECYYDWGDVASRAYFYLRTMYTMNPLKIIRLTTLSNASIADKLCIGTFGKQIELPYTNKLHTIRFEMIFDTSFQMFMIAESQIIEITEDFKFSIFESEYGSYMQQHENGLAIKGISNALSLAMSVGKMATGNPAGLLGTIHGVENIAGDIGMLKDLQEQPLKLNAIANCVTNLVAYNGIGVFTYLGFNGVNIVETDTYYGRKTQRLRDLTLTHIATPTINFDYFQFDDVEMIAKMPEEFKDRMSKMFVDGVRIWYDGTNFLKTINRTITP